MLRCFLFLSFAVLVVGSQFVSLNVHDPSVQQSARAAAAELSKQFSSKYNSKLVEVKMAKVDKGKEEEKYDLVIIVGETTCKKKYAVFNVDACKFRRGFYTEQKCDVLVSKVSDKYKMESSLCRKIF